MKSALNYIAIAVGIVSFTAISNSAERSTAFPQKQHLERMLAHDEYFTHLFFNDPRVKPLSECYNAGVAKNIANHQLKSDPQLKPGEKVNLYWAYLTDTDFYDEIVADTVRDCNEYYSGLNNGVPKEQKDNLMAFAHDYMLAVADAARESVFHKCRQIDAEGDMKSAKEYCLAREPYFEKLRKENKWGHLWLE